jgi:hypothetical protein
MGKVRLPDSEPLQVEEPELTPEELEIHRLKLELDIKENDLNNKSAYLITKAYELLVELSINKSIKFIKGESNDKLVSKE